MRRGGLGVHVERVGAELHDAKELAESEVALAFQHCAVARDDAQRGKVRRQPGGGVELAGMCSARCLVVRRLHGLPQRL